MDRRAKLELFEQLRREYEFGVGTISGVAKMNPRREDLDIATPCTRLARSRVRKVKCGDSTVFEYTGRRPELKSRSACVGIREA